MPETLEAPVQTPVADSVIQVRDLDFYYGKFQGLRKVNLDIARRKVTAFIGPSGCGKSTLLRTFNRMFDLYPGQRAEGSIVFNGKNILDKDQDVNLLRAKVGMVFQKPTPFPMSIFENIAFGIRLYETLSSADMANRVEWALRKAALWEEVKDKLNQSGLSLSGGQQQRLCIARTVAVRPDVLLLDINMPGITGWEFLDQLKALNLEANVYMYSSSIDPDDVKEARNYPMVRDFISKPLDARTIRQILSLNQEQRKVS